MNRALVITIGILIILMVLGAWVYLMFFASPEKNSEIFTNLGFELSDQDTTVTPPPVNTTPVNTLVDTQTDALRQLTTRPVAGFAFASTSDGDAVRYIEKGTGHMYQIILDSGVESIVSRTTIPGVHDAFFSPSTQSVIFISYTNYIPNVFIGKLGDDENIVGSQLGGNIQNITFDSDSEIRYSISEDGITKGYRHNLETTTRTELFSINYMNIDVHWGETSAETYISTKPTKDLEGFIYIIEDTILLPIGFSAYGLSALAFNNTVIETYLRDGVYTSVAISKEGKESILPILAIKEKCVSSPVSENYLLCASPIQTPTGEYVEDWYKGLLTSEDYLWSIDIQEQTAQLLVDPKSETGRIIDVSNIQTNQSSNTLLFTNKTDSTLWLYDLLR